MNNRAQKKRGLRTISLQSLRNKEKDLRDGNWPTQLTKAAQSLPITHIKAKNPRL